MLLGLLPRNQAFFLNRIKVRCTAGSFQNVGYKTAAESGGEVLPPGLSCRTYP
jgi:hypothetical protein